MERATRIAPTDHGMNPAAFGRDESNKSARDVLGRADAGLEDRARVDHRFSEVVPASRRKAALRCLVVAAEQVKRVSIAAALGVPESTLRHWLSPGDVDRSPPLGVLLRLACDRSLPEAARVALLESLLDGSGLSVVVAAESDPEQAPLSTQLVQAQEALGLVAGRVLESVRSAGPGGESITRAEAASIVAGAMRLQGEVAELIETVRRMA